MHYTTNVRLGTLIMLISGLGFLQACKKNETSIQNKASIEKISNLKFELLQPSPQEAIENFYALFCALDTLGASRFVVSYREHRDFYPYSPQPDTQAGSAEFIAQMYASGNKKHYFRWMDQVLQDSLVFSRFEITQPEENHGAYSFIKGVKVYLKKPSGAEVEFPLFHTLLKLPGSYKIWAFEDT